MDKPYRCIVLPFGLFVKLYYIFSTYMKILTINSSGKESLYGILRFISL